MSAFAERLRDHAASLRGLSAEEGSPEHRAPAPASPSGSAQVPQLSFWQSPVARAAINRRISGDPELRPEVYFARRHGPAMVAPHAVSLRPIDAKLEIGLLEAGRCEHVTGLDEDSERLALVAGRLPEPLRDSFTFALGALERWEPPEPLGAAVCRNFLHRRADLEQVTERLATVLAPGGLLFVEDFVGPARFQWSDDQLAVINRLLACLPPALLADLSADDGRLKRSVERPSLERLVAGGSQEAVRSDEIIAVLDARFERVEIAPYGGAVVHQLFSRIMGNFAERPELVSVLMELDALLTDMGVLPSDYIWGVWRRP